jgi:hypothetical protein
MGILQPRHLKAIFGALLGVAAVALVVTIVTGSSAVAQSGNEDFDKAGSLQALKSARGQVADWAHTTDGRDWTLVGEWSLDCGKKCTETHLSQIEFDMAFSMYRESVKSQDNSSHGHPFWDFIASDVSLAGDTLTIEGDITGSGEIGRVGIEIEIQKQANGHFTFFFTLDDVNSIDTEVAGVVTDAEGG